MKQRKVENNGLTGVYYAGTKLHGSKVYGLGGTIGPDGKPKRGVNLKTASPEELGSFPISMSGITDEMVKKAWFVLANGYYEAYGDIAKLAKKKGETGEQATALLAKVEEHLATQAKKFTDGGISTMASYEKAERLYENMKQTKAKALRDLTGELKDALSDAAKTDTIKEELKARSAFEKVTALAAKNTVKAQEQAKAGFTQLAEKLPNTHYGKLAGMRAKAL